MGNNLHQMKNWVIGISRTVLVLLFCDTLVLICLNLHSAIFNNVNIDLTTKELFIGAISFFALVWLFRMGNLRGDFWAKIFTVGMSLFLVVISFFEIAVWGSGHIISVIASVEYISLFFIFFLFVSYLLRPHNTYFPK